MVMGRNGYGPKWSWAEMVLGRNDPESEEVVELEAAKIKSKADCGLCSGVDGVSPSVFRCTSTPMETGPIVTCGET